LLASRQVVTGPVVFRVEGVEQVLVEMLDETDALALMDTSEAVATFLQMAASDLIQIPVVQRFAGFKWEVG
jgi:hypothetical protein